MIAAKPGELVVRMDRPLPGASVVLDEGAVALERRRVEAVEVELVDLHDLVGFGERGVQVAPLVDAVPHQVAASLVVQNGRVRLLRDARVRDRIDRLVFDLDELGGVAGQLARLCHDGDDRLADEADLAEREREVLDVAARNGCDLEERVGQRRDFLSGQGPVDARQSLGGRHVDRGDVRVRERRADEVQVPHAMALDVVDEHSLALHEPAVLLTGDALARPRLLGDLDLLRGDGRAAHSAAAFTASKMFQ